MLHIASLYTISQLQPSVKYALAFGCMLAVEAAYIWVARRLHITASINERSSHVRPTPTGGGVILVLAGLAFVLFNYGSLTPNWLWMLGGGLLLATISFIDDIHPLPPLPRLLIQIVVMGAAFNVLCYSGAMHVYILAIACGVGCINAFNFIDGINGMLTFYGMVVMGTIIYMLHLGQPHLVQSMHPYAALATMTMLALAVVAVFNATGRVFAGDVGSTVIGYIVAFLLISLMIATKDASLVVLIVVILCDAGMTCLHRLFYGVNILTPHRMHIYQVLCNQCGYSHLSVSISYALLQLAINLGYMTIPATAKWTYVIVVSAILASTYFILRRRLRR